MNSHCCFPHAIYPPLDRPKKKGLSLLNKNIPMS